MSLGNKNFEDPLGTHEFEVAGKSYKFAPTMKAIRMFERSTDNDVLAISGGYASYLTDVLEAGMFFWHTREEIEEMCDYATVDQMIDVIVRRGREDVNQNFPEAEEEPSEQESEADEIESVRGAEEELLLD